MHPLLAEIAADPTAARLLADSGDGAAGIAFPFLLGPAVFLGTYLGIYRYYRNHDKSHAYERDTLIEAQPVQGSEHKVDHISKTRARRIKGDNGSDHRDRVRRAR